MADNENEGFRFGNILRVALASLGIVTICSFIAGFMAQHRDDGGGAFGVGAIVILATAVAVILALAYVVGRNVKLLGQDGEALTRRERLNRNILAACGLLGGLMGVVIAAIGLRQGDSGLAPILLLTETPLPLGLALALTFVWAVIMPVVAYWWHRRAIDEQEASAYRDGSLLAGYTYLIGAPSWWLLWRGGIAPEPDGVTIFMTFTLIWLAVWFWKKYR